MALTAAFVTAQGNATGNTFITMYPGTSVPVGSGCLVVVVCDNSEAGGTSPVSSVTDNQGETYSPVLSYTYSPTSTPEDGITLALYLATYASSGFHTVNANFSNTTYCKAVQAFSLTPSANGTIAYYSNTTTSGNSNALSGTVTGVPNGYTVFGVGANESNRNMTGDSDTTNGTWDTARTLAMTRSGASFANEHMRAVSQFKTVTGTGDQTWNATWSDAQDYAAIVLVVYEDTGSSTGQVKVYTGASFEAKPVKVYNGSSWEVKPAKVWNGSAWAVTNY